MATLNEMEQVGRSAILKAGELIREYTAKRSSISVTLKGPSDFVTQVDRACEELIIEAIRSRFPDHHIMAEETTNDGFQDGITWVIDPLDGTTNFIHGFPFVAVSIAACRSGSPLVGLVLDPVREELFSAVKGEGAYLNDEPIHVRESATLEDSLIATGFPYRTRPIIESYLKSLRHIFEAVSGIRRAGAAALDLAYVAAGRVDGFWEPGLAPWDVAAGALLVQEAGGIVSDFWGEANHIQNGHIVAGTPVVQPFLLEQVQAHLSPAVERKGGPAHRR
jgi:myo-inositol-1(or 4)-monophosphatase